MLLLSLFSLPAWSATPFSNGSSFGYWKTSHLSPNKLSKEIPWIVMKRLLEFNGPGSYEDHTEMLRLIVDLVEASIYAENPEWSVNEQVAKDMQLIDSIAEKLAQIFAEECKLFPADVQIQSIYPLHDVLSWRPSLQNNQR